MALVGVKNMTLLHSRVLVLRSRRESPHTHTPARAAVPPQSNDSPLGIFSGRGTPHVRCVAFKERLHSRVWNVYDPVVYVCVGKDVADATARFMLANEEGVPERKEFNEGP